MLDRIFGAHPRPTLDPIAILERDHREFERLLESIHATGEGATVRRTALFGRLSALLHAHELVEERILYPALAGKKRTGESVAEGYQEHHLTDLALAELSRLPVTHPEWRMKVHVLGEALKHHIDEEEDEMFPGARRELAKERLEDLGRRIKSRRADELERSQRRGRAAPKSRPRATTARASSAASKPVAKAKPASKPRR